MFSVKAFHWNLSQANYHQAFAFWVFAHGRLKLIFSDWLGHFKGQPCDLIGPWAKSLKFTFQRLSSWLRTYERMAWLPVVLPLRNYHLSIPPLPGKCDHNNRSLSLCGLLIYEASSLARESLQTDGMAWLPVGLPLRNYHLPIPPLPRKCDHNKPCLSLYWYMKQALWPDSPFLSLK